MAKQPEQPVVYGGNDPRRVLQLAARITSVVEDEFDDLEPCAVVYALQHIIHIHMVAFVRVARIEGEG